MNTRLLIITQKVDKNDPILGFFHGWIVEFAKTFRSIVVIALEKDKYDLPGNVAVLSLGKEKWRSKVKYIFLLFYFSFRYYNRYDAVFVHMNEEYAVIAGWLWRLMGKKVYLWRNHAKGNAMTNIAAIFCNRIFCTSKHSYTAKFRKTTIMPVGINTDIFKPLAREVSRIANSFLFIGRIAPIKNVDVFIQALDILNRQGMTFSASIYGDALPKDFEYFSKLKEMVNVAGLGVKVKFIPGVPQDQAAAIYASHEIYVNITPNGSYDKTILESMACNTLLVTSNLELEGKVDERLIIKKIVAESVAEKMLLVSQLSTSDKSKIIADNQKFVEGQSLKSLISRLEEFMPRERSKRFLGLSSIVLRFSISGLVTAVISLSVLFILTDVVGIWYIISGVISFIIAVLTSFCLQRLFTFKDVSGSNSHFKFVIFLATSIFNLALNTSLLYLFTDIIGIYYIFSQIIAAAFIAVWSFFVFRWIFSRP